MVIVWLSHANRKRRRARTARARQLGIESTISHASAAAVGGHIRALTTYFIDPDPRNLKALMEVEQTAARYLPMYFGAEKSEAELISQGRATPTGERVLYSTTRGLLSESLEDQQLEMQLVAGLSPGSEDPVEHIVISLSDGEHPTHEQVEEMLDLLLKVVRMEGHQVFATLHGDTKHTHLHLAINRVHPIHGDRRAFGGDEVFAMDALHQAIAVIAHRQSWLTQENALYRADENGVFDRRTNLKVLDADLQPCCPKGNWKTIKAARRERERDEKLSAASRRFEQRTALHSLQRVMLFEVGPELVEAETWNDVHERLAVIGARYVLVSGGGQVEFGERSVPATWAGSAASPAKLGKRFGKPYEPPSPELSKPPYRDREFPALREALKTHRQRVLIRRAQESATISAEVATGAVAAEQRAAAATINARDWTGRGGSLRVARQEAASQSREARVAIAALRRRHIGDCKRWRRLLAAEHLHEGFLDEHDPNLPAAILVGSKGNDSPLEPRHEAGISVQAKDRRIEYWRDDNLLFVDQGYRIDLYAVRDDNALTAAMRLAATKWDNKVIATGDRATLARLARIAAEQDIELGNPELQDLIRSHQTRIAREREAEAARGTPRTALAQASPAPVSFASVHNGREMELLDSYEPAFRKWVAADADPVRCREADEIALRIVSDRRLARELEELIANRFAFAERLKVGAKLAARRAEKAAETAVSASRDAELAFETEAAPLRGGNEMELNSEEAAGAAPEITGEIAGLVQKQSELLEPQGRTRFSTAMARARSQQAALAKQTTDTLNRQLHRFVRPSEGLSAIVEAFLMNVREQPEYYDVKNRKLQVRTGRGNRETATDLLTRDETVNEQAMQAFERSLDLGATVSSEEQARRRQELQRLAHVNWMHLASEPARRLEQSLPALLRTRPLITKGTDGVLGIEDQAIVAAAGEDALGLFSRRAQELLEAAFRIQEEERLDALALVASRTVKVRVSAQANPPFRMAVSADKDMPPLSATFERFRYDPSFIKQCKLAEKTGQPAPNAAHATVRAWRKAEQDQVAPDVVRYLADAAWQKLTIEELQQQVGDDLRRMATITDKQHLIPRSSRIGGPSPRQDSARGSAPGSSR